MTQRRAVLFLLATALVAPASSSAAPAHTRRVAEVDRAEVITSPDQDEIERLAALAREGAP